MKIQQQQKINNQNNKIDNKFLPLGIIVLDVNGLVTVIDVCAMVLDGNAVI